MNCSSEYPVTDYTHVRLGVIEKLRNEFNVLVGQSDHTDDLLTTYLSVGVHKAKVIEKHFTLDRNGPFPDDKMSLDPGMMKELVTNVRRLEKDPSILPELIRGREADAIAALSSAEKNITVEEQIIREWAFHSVVTNSAGLKKGEKLTLNNVRPARPGWGIPAKYLDERHSAELLGRPVNKDIPPNEVVYWRDIA
jgi:N,N'-diacetyllegionaminate synthase